MTHHRQRFEVLLPLTFPDGSPVPVDLILKTQREVQYEFGAITVEAQVLQGFDRESGAQRDRLVRLFVDVRDTPENLAYFYKLKQELQVTFQQQEIRITTFPVGVV